MKTHLARLAVLGKFLDRLTVPAVLGVVCFVALQTPSVQALKLNFDAHGVGWLIAAFTGLAAAWYVRLT